MKIDIVLPVFKGLEEVTHCIESIFNAIQRTEYELVILNDASPDPSIVRYLKQVDEENKSVTLIHNRHNEGFVRTVNRGMALHPDRDVVILNSDTQVCNDWLDRLIETAYSNDRIGTVTPFSNNAALCSFPRAFYVNEIQDDTDLCTLDRVFSQVNKSSWVRIPTGVGFCMYAKRACLELTGSFDEEVFEKGYGEENDFCMRATAKGWDHALCASVFVFHEGGVSFGGESRTLSGRAQEKLADLHPAYHQLLKRFIAEDPAGPYRLLVLIELWKRKTKHKVLFLTHHLGGGTEQHVHELAAHLSELADFLVIRPTEKRNVYSVCFGTSHDAVCIQVNVQNDYTNLLDILKYIGIAQVHFHHTLGIDKTLIEIADDLDVPFDVTIHDYFLINGNTSQTDKRGRYCPDPAKLGIRDIPDNLMLDEWMKKQALFLSKAARVFTPSRKAAQLMKMQFPAANYVTVYHPDHVGDYPPTRVRESSQAGPLRVLVMGALNTLKGADTLERVAVHSEKQNRPLEFHVLGYADRPLKKIIIQHGTYDRERLIEKIGEIDPDVIWFPAQWHETYSYTLSEALQFGRPVVATDMGSFPERLENRPLTWVVPADHDTEQWVGLLLEVREKLITAGKREWPWNDQPHLSRSEFDYRKDYLTPFQATSGAEFHQFPERARAWLFSANRFLDRSRSSLSRRESALMQLFRLRETEIGKRVSKLIPGRVQRKIKRLLSRRPMHELI